MSIGERIKAARKARSMTQQELSYKTGLSRSAIAAYESSNSDPSDRTIRDISSACRVSEDWLRTGDGDMEVPVSRSSMISAVVDGLTATWPPEKRRFIQAVAAVDDPRFWDTIAELAEKLAEKREV